MDKSPSIECEAVFNRIKEALQVKTETGLGIKLGIKQPSVARARKCKQVPPGWIVKISERYGISADWLLYGIGRVSRNEKYKIIKSEKQDHSVTIDFSGRKELLNHLEKYAGEEIRSVEDQIMYFIQNQLSFEEAEADGNQG